jgi:hypothetical protein
MSLMPEQKIDRTKEPDITSVTYLLFAINIALEEDGWKNVTFSDVYVHLDSGDLIPFLATRLQTLDLSILAPDQPQGRLLLAALRHVAGWFEERERRKTGVEKSGVCLVIAWIGEVVQKGQWQLDRSFYDDEPENLIDFPRS